MAFLDPDRSRLSGLIVHYVGNPLKDQELRLSAQLSPLDDTTRQILWQYVSQAFREPLFYRLSHPVEVQHNSVYQICGQLFDQPQELVAHSARIARWLQEVSQHPQVRSGELLVMYFPQLAFENLETPAIGLFKIEAKQPFLFTENEGDSIGLHSFEGIQPGKVDKAALIFDDDREGGFQVLSVDNVNGATEARFWFDDFLKLQPRQTEFSRTSAVIDLTRNFIEQDLGSREDADRTEAVGLLQRTRDFFKDNERFAYEQFENAVFEDENLGHRFREYTREKPQAGFDVEEDFDISAVAVAKKQRVFKSVIKLDRNFHIYVHGNRQMIERGTDEQGRKYYKLYYEEEH